MKLLNFTYVQKCKKCGHVYPILEINEITADKLSESSCIIAFGEYPLEKMRNKYLKYLFFKGGELSDSLEQYLTKNTGGNELW